MSAFREIEGNSTDMELMKQWLLRQKQTQSWGSTPSTVDAIYALLLTGNNQLTSSEDLSVKLGNKNLRDYCRGRRGERGCRGAGRKNARLHQANFHG